LLDSKMSKFLPSEQAAAAMLYAERKLKRSSSSSQQLQFLNEWQKMEKHSGYTLENLSACYHVFESLVKSMASSQLKAVFRKFKSGKYFEVARLAQQAPPSNSKPSSAATGVSSGP